MMSPSLFLRQSLNPRSHFRLCSCPQYLNLDVFCLMKSRILEEINNSTSLVPAAINKVPAYAADWEIRCFLFRYLYVEDLFKRRKQ